MEDVDRLASIFALVSDPVRLRIVQALLEANCLCASDLAHQVEVTAPNLSNHLRLMRLQNIVQTRKQGKQVIYSLTFKNEIEQLIHQAKKLVS